MANSFVTAKLIAEKALPMLLEQISMLPLTNPGEYDGTFKKAGDTIQIRKPIRGITVDGSGDISSSLQDIKDESVEVVLNNQRTYPVSFTSKQRSLNIDDMSRQIIAPAMAGLAEYVNEALLALYVDVPYFYGASGTTPDALSDIANSRKILVDNKAPGNNRAFVFDSAAEAKFLQLDSLVEVDKSGTNQALRDAAIGRVYGMTLASDTMIKTHTAGAYSALTDVSIGAGAAGATSITLESTAGTSVAVLKKGDIFSIDEYQFVVTADTAAASSGDIASVSIYPALPNAFGDFTSAAVTFADVTAGGHVANLMFQKDAFTLAMAPLEAPKGVESYTASYRGLSIRVVEDYNINTDTSIMRFDILFGVKTTFPQLAVRVLG